MSTQTPKFRNGDVVRVIDGSVGVIVTDSSILPYSPSQNYFVQRLGRGSAYRSSRQWYKESEIAALDEPDMKALSEANIPRPMCTQVDDPAELFEVKATVHPPLITHEEHEQLRKDFEFLMSGHSISQNEAYDIGLLDACALIHKKLILRKSPFQPKP